MEKDELWMNEKYEVVETLDYQLIAGNSEDQTKHIYSV